jgi:membrane protein
VDLEGIMTFLKCFSRFLYAQGRENNIINLSAQMSYRTLSAFIPFLMLLYNLINWFSAGVNETLVFVLSKILPQSIMDYVNLAMENASTISFSWGTLDSIHSLSVFISADYLFYGFFLSVRGETARLYF